MTDLILHTKSFALPSLESTDKFINQNIFIYNAGSGWGGGERAMIVTIY